MDFVLWVARLMHGISAVVWIGGLIFLNVVLSPLLDQEGASHLEFAQRVRTRFFPFIWFSIWTMLTTGIFLMVLNPRFIWLDVSTLWSRLLVVKQVCFALLVFVSWQASRVNDKLEELTQKNEENSGWREGFQKLIRRSIALGLLALMSAAGMAVC